MFDSDWKQRADIEAHKAELEWQRSDLEDSMAFSTIGSITLGARPGVNTTKAPGIKSNGPSGPRHPVSRSCERRKTASAWLPTIPDGAP